VRSLAANVLDASTLGQKMKKKSALFRCHASDTSRRLRPPDSIKFFWTAYPNAKMTNPAKDGVSQQPEATLGLPLFTSA